jgi:hypothetical protein
VDHTLYAPICKCLVKSALHGDILYDIELEIGAVRLELIEEKVGCRLGADDGSDAHVGFEKSFDNSYSQKSGSICAHAYLSDS